MGSMNTRSNGQIKVTAFVKETSFQANVVTGYTINLKDSQILIGLRRNGPICVRSPLKHELSHITVRNQLNYWGNLKLTAVENYNNKITVTTIHVAAGKLRCLLKGFITVHVNKIDTAWPSNAKHSVHGTNVNQDITVSNSYAENIFTHPDANINELLLKHQRVFKGNGCLI